MIIYSPFVWTLVLNEFDLFGVKNGLNSVNSKDKKYFGQGVSVAKYPPTLKINSQQIEVTKTAKYTEIHRNHKKTIDEHIESTIKIHKSNLCS